MPDESDSADRFERNYDLLLTEAAQQHLQEITGWIGWNQDAVASGWLGGLQALLELIADFTVDFSIARKNASARREIRQVVHHPHRILYFVDHERREVVICAIWHVRRQNVPPHLLR